MKLALAPRVHLWRVRKRRGPPRIKERSSMPNGIIPKSNRKEKEQYDTNINHIHSMEIILQETADLYFMLLSEMLQLVYLQGNFYFHTLNNSVCGTHGQS
jgi:hypothetical protein